MISTDTPFTEELINNTILAYSKEKRFSLSIEGPLTKNSKRFRLIIYYRKYLRTTIANSVEEFLDILKMYEELERD